MIIIKDKQLALFINTKLQEMNYRNNSLKYNEFTEEEISKIVRLENINQSIKDSLDKELEENNKFDFIFGNNGKVYKVEKERSLHDMTPIEKWEFSKRKVATLQKESEEYKYYSTIIENLTNILEPQKITLEEAKKNILLDNKDQVEDIHEKSYEEKIKEYFKNFNDANKNMEYPKRNNKEIARDILKKLEKRQRLDEEELSFLNSLTKKTTPLISPNFYIEKNAGIDPNELEWYYSQYKNIEISGDMNPNRIR